MAYEEYDYYNEPAGEGKSVKETLREILNGFRSEKNWREVGEGLSKVRDIIPNVTESLSRGGVAQAIGTSGDLRDLRNTINSYLPKSVSNFTRAVEFLANPYATAIQETAPTTESTLDFVPRMTDTYEGYKQHETLGEFIAPSLGYFAGKGAKALKDMPAGMSIMGPESKLWNKEMAFTAGKLEAKGATPDEILEKTGMVRGLDNQWRSELSDINSSLKGEGDTFGTRHATVHPVNDRFTTPERRAQGVLVEDILHHPELLEAYPELGKIKVEAHGSTRGEKGSYSQSKNTISIREDLSPDEARSTILHELTHGVQGIEGMNRGANYRQLVQYFEKQQQDLLPKISELSDQMREANMAGDMEKYRQIMTERDALSKQYTDINPEELGYEAYRNHAGEAEARMVQARRNLTPEELRKQFPYQYTGKEGTGLDIDPDQAIVTTKQPGTINMPEQSIEPPTSQKDELGFHSPLENAILKIQQPKGTGDQFLKQLEKTPGVKTEELDVSGVKQYLLDHPNVTKQELLDHMKENRLNLENKVLGPAIEDTYGDYQLQGGDVYHDDDYISSLADDLHYDMKNDDVIRSQEREAILENDPERYMDWENNPSAAERLEQDIDGSLYDQAKQQAEEMYYENPIRHYYDEHGYDIYGNDDNGYSFKDPSGRFLDIGGRNGVYDISDAEDALRQHLLDEGVIDIDGGGAKYEDYTLPGNYTNYREMLTTLPNKTGGDFQSSHYDEPNILAHTRLNDRIIDGKKTLMVEEIQSDWHQEGRKKGYWSPGNQEKMDELTKSQGGLHKEKMALREKYDEARKTDDIDSQNEISKQIADIEKQQVTKQAEINKLGTTPDAPFKKNWHELMMKQILNEAVEGGYDAIAFTTGKQQAERYNLSKQVDQINWMPYESNGSTKVVRIQPLNGNTIELRLSPEGAVMNGGQFANKSIDEVIGKDIAKKIMDSNTGDLSGVNLDIGGEGMKGFYDKILPDFVNKYTKKYGMGVKKANLPSPTQKNWADFREWAIDKDPSTNDTFLNNSWDNKDSLYKEYMNAPAKDLGEEVHFVDLSDMAKKDIKSKGQPLFSGIGLAAPALMPEDQDKTKK